jgi:integrase
MAKLTKRLIDGLATPESDTLLWDDGLPGFGLRVRPSGRRAFVVQYRTADGRQRRRTIGTYPVLTVEQARAQAREWLSGAQRGQDPALTRDRNRAATTVAKLCERFLEGHADLHKKASSATEDRRLIERYIKPVLGQQRAPSVTHDDVERLHKSLRETPYQANRMLALLSAVLNQAEPEMRAARPDWMNPCRRVRRFKEEKRRRYLAPAELARLGEALTEAEQDGAVKLVQPDGSVIEEAVPKEAVVAIRLLVFTGCRRSEILSLPWSAVDLDGRRLRLDDSKTGAKDVYLAPPAVAVLQAIEPSEGNPYVIPGRKKGAHMQELKGAWQRVRARAGLDDVRLHDLRHSFASMGAGVGLSLPIIGALLGHTQAATTQRYAHLASDPLREAADLVGQRLADALGRAGAAPDSVVPLASKRKG